MDSIILPTGVGNEGRVENEEDYMVTWGTQTHSSKFVNLVGVEKDIWCFGEGLTKTPS